ncbi:MAG: YdeI/OmpD-associated family protein [Candidatus Sulfotelmatobacter sp.]|jgi:uncharacterized protein YdeI (YjbR/CyaY-like superfamily)
MAPKPHFFPSPAHWRAWLKEHHKDAAELWVGLYKRESGRPSITWPEAVDGALCFGWIDGIRKSVSPISYTIRFTPRRPGSVWSAVNVRRASELSARGLMHATGLAAFEQREGQRTESYSYEQRKTAELPVAYRKTFRANPGAWNFFQDQAPWYRRTCNWWVISAKKEETKRKRLAELIGYCEHGRTLPALTRSPRKK